MVRIDIPADLNDQDETGYVWTFLDEARERRGSGREPSWSRGLRTTPRSLRSSTSYPRRLGPSCTCASSPAHRGARPARGPGGVGRPC
jgi:hypothetical protein